MKGKIALAYFVGFLVMATAVYFVGQLFVGHIQDLGGGV